MRTDGDAMGHMLLDYSLGLDAIEIIERDDGLIDAAQGGQLYFSEYEQWSSLEQQSIELVQGRVLDVGCGAGRHALYLQKQGHDVLGIDQSPLAIRVCKIRGLVNAHVLPITGINRSLGQFDTIIMMGNNFGLLANLKRARWLLKRFHSITSEKGRIVASTLDPYVTSDPLHLDYHQRNIIRGRMAGQVRIRVRYKTFKDSWFDYLFVSREEMEKIVSGTGWAVTKYIEGDSSLYAAILDKK